MIDYVKGEITEKNLGEVVIEACGIGYSLIIPLSTYEKLPDIGHSVKILTYHYVREDMEKLYGFFTGSERDLFRH